MCSCERFRGETVDEPEVVERLNFWDRGIERAPKSTTEDGELRGKVESSAIEEDEPASCSAFLSAAS